jgi:hypothetical protein
MSDHDGARSRRQVVADSGRVDYGRSAAVSRLSGDLGQSCGAAFRFLTTSLTFRPGNRGGMPIFVLDQLCRL